MSIEELVPGKLYRVIVWGNLRPDGTRPRKTKRVHGGIRAAQDAERKLIARREEGKDSTPQTVAQYVEKFIASKEREGRASRTIRHYRQSFAYLPEGLLKKRLAKVKAGDLRDLFGELAENPRLSGTTRNGIERDIKALFRQAREVTGKDVQRGIAKTPVDGKEPLALSPAEGAAFLRGLEGTTVYLPAVLMYCTGVRPEEMRALCWDCVDLDAGVVKVERRAVTVGKREVLTKKLKTKRSKRALSIDQALSTLLAAERLEIGLLRSERGPHWADLDLVFPTLRCHSETLEAGRIWTASAFNHAWEKARPRRDVTPYTMRHTFITQRLMEGVRLEVVSRLAGHASSYITSTRYSHVIEEELHDVVVRPPTTEREGQDG